MRVREHLSGSIGAAEMGALAGGALATFTWLGAIDPDPSPPHDGGSLPPLLQRSAQALARPDRHTGQWLSDGREPLPQARFRGVYLPRSSQANATGARGFERSGSDPEAEVQAAASFGRMIRPRSS
jgi:hypothetical protein